MKGLTLSQREQTRLQVLNQLVGHQISAPEAAVILGLSERHTWRMLAAYLEEGAAALAHGNRGRRPANAISQDTRQRVITLACTQYSGFNHTHLTELLAEREGLFLTRSTVRGILAGAGIPSPRRRRPPRHRQRRERKAQEGMLLQMDGSPHDWLKGRGPASTLLLAVDDATGTIAAASFRSQEDTLGYLLLFQDIVRRHGIPLAVYTDRHAVFQHNHTLWDEDHQTGKRIPTQFARALKELGVTQVFARSPQAKGRVERANGTFQDRLVAELRLAGADTAAEANVVLAGFLPRFNARFRVPAAQTGSAYRAPDAGLDLASTLCIKNRRKVAKDNTVLYRQSTLQLFPTPDHPSYSGAIVEVQERLDGQLVVSYQGKTVASRTAPPHARMLRGRGVTGLKHGPGMPMPASLAPSATDPNHDHDPQSGEALLRQVDEARLAWHSQCIKEGMERARQRGQLIGRPRVSEGYRLRPDFIIAQERIRQGDLTVGRAAKELGIGYATLKRLLESTTQVPPHLQAKENGTAGNAPGVPSPPALPIYHSPDHGTSQGIIDLTDKFA